MFQILFNISLKLYKHRHYYSSWPQYHHLSSRMQQISTAGSGRASLHTLLFIIYKLHIRHILHIAQNWDKNAFSRQKLGLNTTPATSSSKERMSATKCHIFCCVTCLCSVIRNHFHLVTTQKTLATARANDIKIRLWSSIWCFIWVWVSHIGMQLQVSLWI